MANSPQFQTTRWTVVLQAADRSSPEHRAAMAAMLQVYWYPLFVFIRRQGYDVHQAEDLLQGFLTRLLEKDLLQNVGEGHGRFRNFLLVCLRRFLANEAEREQAAKRGGGTAKLSFDFAAADARYRHEPADELTPQRQFERDWAIELLERTFQRLAEAWSAAGKHELFSTLKEFLVAPREGASYAATAQRFGMTEGAVKTAVHRLRAQFRQILCDEVAATVDRDELLEDEIRRLFSALQA
jgi:RNA polymerase sigma-70 factor (ECF subfamily)